MKTAKQYIAAGCFSWLNVSMVLNPAVPVNLGGIEALRANFRQAGPKHLDSGMMIEVAVPAGATWAQMTATMGEWRFVSPEEPVHAMVLALHDSIHRGDSEETLMPLACFLI